MGEVRQKNKNILTKIEGRSQEPEGICFKGIFRNK
jgi:hypothetical protein